MAQPAFDLIVIGGGIHGLMIALQASEAGQRVLLVEKDRLGGATTAGWFGILHGGLRYLQSADIPRFRSSLADSRWFAANFPDLVRRQGFLMPLYNRGLKRPAGFRAAFLLDRILGPDRNRGLADPLAPGRILSPAEVRAQFPAVPQAGLTGGALWEELVVPESGALIAALRARAEASGLTLAEATRALRLTQAEGQVTGLEIEGPGGPAHRSAPRIVNATGAWSPDLAQSFDPGAPRLGHPARAFNLLLDLPPPSALGLSLTPPDGGGMLFLYPLGGKTFAGTAYLPAEGPEVGPLPAADLAHFLARLAAAVPGFAPQPADVLEVTQGCLPARGPGKTDLLDRDVIHDHGARGGPRGLLSLWGVKYTTAPSLARRLLKTLPP